MSSTIAQGIYDTRLNTNWKPSQPSAAPGGRKFLGNANEGTTHGQQASSEISQDAYNIPGQQSSPYKQTSSDIHDDGQYHPNQQSSNNSFLSGSQIPDDKTLNPAAQRNPLAEQSNPQAAQAAQDAQIIASHDVSPYKQAPSNYQDDGQYHPKPAWGKDPSTSTDSHQYHAEQPPVGDDSSTNQQYAPTQHGSNTNAGQDKPLNWDQVAPPSETWSSVTDSTQSPTLTQLHPLPTTSQTTYTSTPPIPTSPASSPSANSAVTKAGISLAVICSVGLIAILILLPLRKKRNRLRKVLGHQKEDIVERNLKGPSQTLNEFASKVYTNIARMVCSMTYLLRVKRPGTYIDGMHGSIETGNSAIACRKSPIEVLSPPQESSSTSLASWATDRSNLSSNSPVTQPEHQSWEQSNSPDMSYTNSLGWLENLSMGNFLAVNPLANNIHTVEINYNSRRADQLELRVGQRLSILQVFDNGWAFGVRLDCPEAGLVPRSHISAVPDTQPLQCSEEKRKSTRNSFPQRSFSALTSRFYSMFSPSAQRPHPSSFV